MVSVPWAITMPSAPSPICLATALAICVQCFGVMFSLKRLKSICVCMRAMLASSGTTLYRSFAVRAGRTAPVL